MITFEDFKKMDLRIAEIKDVEAIPDSDNLWKLTIDIGGERRQLVAGLRKHYTREQLIGRQITIIANLEPKKFRGVESQGMLLAAEEGNMVSLLIPDKKVKVGSRVH